jgi:hypothetical protein
MENIMFTFSLTFAQANIILKHLGAGAYVEVEGVIAAIRDQAASQIQASAQPAVDLSSEETSTE